MTTSGKLYALAERCELATGPHFSFDNAIGKAIAGESGNYSYRPYTASLDAATMLVPPGMLWSVECYPDHSEAVVRFPYVDGAEFRAATPALALCAAALGARAASCDTHPKDGDSTEIEAPLVSGAVGATSAETPKV